MNWFMVFNPAMAVFSTTRGIPLLRATIVCWIEIYTGAVDSASPITTSFGTSCQLREPAKVKMSALNEYAELLYPHYRDT